MKITADGTIHHGGLFTPHTVEERSRRWEARDTEQRRLLAIEQALTAAGINLDDLIALIEARQNGRY